MARFRRRRPAEWETPRFTPAGVMRPSPARSVNHRLPSGPTAMPEGDAFGVGVAKSVTTPAVVMRPMRLATGSVNHKLPSGPAVMKPRPGVSTPGVADATGNRVSVYVAASGTRELRIARADRADVPDR